MGSGKSSLSRQQLTRYTCTTHGSLSSVSVSYQWRQVLFCEQHDRLSWPEIRFLSRSWVIHFSSVIRPIFHRCAEVGVSRPNCTIAVYLITGLYRDKAGWLHITGRFVLNKNTRSPRYRLSARQSDGRAVTQYNNMDFHIHLHRITTVWYQ